MFDDDGLASVDDTDRLHPQCAAGAGLDRAHRDLERPLCHRAIECLPHFVNLDAERIGDHADLSLPFACDGARHGDPRLVVERTAESHRVTHDVGHAVVVVEADLVGVDLLDL